MGELPRPANDDPGLNGSNTVPDEISLRIILALAYYVGQSIILAYPDLELTWGLDENDPQLDSRNELGVVGFKGGVVLSAIGVVANILERILSQQDSIDWSTVSIRTWNEIAEKTRSSRAESLKRFKRKTKVKKKTMSATASPYWHGIKSSPQSVPQFRNDGILWAEWVMETGLNDETLELMKRLGLVPLLLTVADPSEKDGWANPAEVEQAAQRMIGLVNQQDKSINDIQEAYPGAPEEFVDDLEDLMQMAK
jgi:hypothetical protein